MSSSKPFAETSLPRYLEKQILALRSFKTQSDIAAEAGFRSPNMMAMIKSGATRLPLDRVPALAKALNVDAARLMQLALEQSAGTPAARAFEEIFGTPVTRNETAWLEEIRAASGRSDPAVTSRARSAIRASFGR
jgi:transcriptional regulator with XRE-family HTH domain